MSKPAMYPRSDRIPAQLGSCREPWNSLRQNPGKPVLKDGRKMLTCPVCGFKRLIDAAEDTVSQLYPADMMPQGWQPDYFQKCSHCRSEIAIKKIR